eukprot:Rmarinus@m.13950
MGPWLRAFLLLLLLHYCACTNFTIAVIHNMFNDDGSVNVEEMMTTGAVQLAIQEINDKSDRMYDNLLVGHTIELVTRHSGDFFDDYLTLFTDDDEPMNSSVDFVIGGVSLENTMDLASLSREFHRSHLSLSSHRYVGDGAYFAYTARTVASESLQGFALADLIHYVGWSSIAVVSDLSNNMATTAMVLQYRAESLGIEILVHAQITDATIPAAESALQQVQYSGAKVIVLLGTADVDQLFLEAAAAASFCLSDCTLLGDDVLTGLYPAILPSYAPAQFLGYLGTSQVPNLELNDYEDFADRLSTLGNKAETSSSGCSSETDATGGYIWQGYQPFTSSAYSEGGGMDCGGLDFSSISSGSDVPALAGFAYDSVLAIAYGLESYIDSGGSLEDLHADDSLYDTIVSVDVFDGATGEVTFDLGVPTRRYIARGERRVGASFEIFNYDGNTLNIVYYWVNSYSQYTESGTTASISSCSSCAPVVYSNGLSTPHTDEVSQTVLINLGGMFPLFTRMAPYVIDKGGTQRFAAFVMAIDEINESEEILPNTKLNYVLRDSRRDEGRAVAEASALSDAFDGNGVSAVVGPASSEPTKTTQYIFRTVETPQISYSATSPALSDSELYPYFFRSCVSDSFQGVALAEVVKALGWTKLVTLSSTDTYGVSGIGVFLEAAREVGIDVLSSQTIPVDDSSIGAQVQELAASDARLFLLFSPSSSASKVLEHAYAEGILGPGFTWVGSDAVSKPATWENMDLGEGVDSAAAMRGYFGLVPSNGYGTDAYDAFSERWVDQTCTGGDTCPLGCSVETDGEGSTVWQWDHDFDEETEDVCTGFTFTSVFDTYVPYAYDATYAIAHALHRVIEVDGERFVTGELLREALLNVTFEGVTGTVLFDDNGDRAMLGLSYVIRNHDGTQLNTVGEFLSQEGAVFCDPEVDVDCAEVVYSTSDNSHPVDWIGCPPGTHDSSGDCLQCNQYEYQDLYDQPTCKDCPTATQRIFGSAGTNITDCECLPGTWASDGWQPGDSCKDCPEGGQCDGGTVKPYPQQDYWGTSNHPGKFYRCQRARCQGGNVESEVCKKGYGGPVCSECVAGYFSVGNRCNKCLFDNDYANKLVTFVGLVGVVLVWMSINSLAAGKYDAVDVALLYLQICGMISKFDLNWHEDMDKMLLTFLEIMNFDVDYISPQCAMNWSFERSVNTQLALPLVICFIYILKFVLIFLLSRWTAKGGSVEIDLSALRDSYINDFISFLDVTYHTTTIKSLQVFICQAAPGGGSWLVAGPTVTCWSDEHRSILMVGVAGLVVYTLGLPLLYLRVLTQGYKHHKLRDRAYLRRYHCLYARYESDFFWWQLVLMSRRFIFCTIVVALYQEPLLQAGLGTMIIVVNLALHYYSRPFLKNRLDILDAISLFSLVMYMFCGVTFYDETFDYRVAVVAVAHVLVFGTIMTAFIVTVYNIKETKASEKSASLILQIRNRRNKGGVDRHDLRDVQTMDDFKRIVVQEFTDLDMGELHRTILPQWLVCWAYSEDLDGSSVRLYNDVDEWISPYVADDSVTSNYTHHTKADFYRTLTDAFPWLVDWAASADEATHSGCIQVFDSWEAMFGARASLTYNRLIVEEDLASVIFALSHTPWNLRAQLVELFDMILSVNEEHARTLPGSIKLRRARTALPIRITSVIPLWFAPPHPRHIHRARCTLKSYLHARSDYRMYTQDAQFERKRKRKKREKKSLASASSTSSGDSFGENDSSTMAPTSGFTTPTMSRAPQEGQSPVHGSRVANRMYATPTAAVPAKPMFMPATTVEPFVAEA